MPLGNSITRGVVGGNGGAQVDDVGYRKALFNALQPVYPGLDFVGTLSHGDGGFDQDHEGRSGWDADQIRDNVYLTGGNWLTTATPHVVLLHIGTNDLGDQPLTEIVGEVEQILDRIDQYETDNNTEVVVFVARIIRFLIGDPDGSETTSFNNQVEAMVNQRIANGDKLVMVDQESAITYPGGLPDDIHPDLNGYNNMAAVWQQAIISTLTAPQVTEPTTLIVDAGELFEYQIVSDGIPAPEINVSNLPTGMTYDNTTQTVSWIADETQLGPASFDVTATNPLGVDNKTINLMVEEINGPPVFTKGPDITIDEDAGPQEFLGWATGIDDGDSNQDQNLSFNIDNVMSSTGQTIAPAINASGDLTFTSGNNVNGVFTITISLTDDGNPPQTSAGQTFNITINPVNDPPVFTLSEDNLELTPGFAPTQIAVIPQEVPPDEISQTVTYSLAPESVSFVDISIDNNGTISINPVPDNPTGTQEFAVLANDGQESNNLFVASFNLSVGLTVGIEDELTRSIKMYPNPADNRLNVELENNYLGPVNLQLYDLRGSLIKSETYLKTTTRMDRSVDVQQIKSGLYLMQVQLDGKAVWDRLIIE